MRLTTLSLYQCKRVDNLEPLRGMPLTDLQLSVRKDLDLSSLAASPIEVLTMVCNEYTPSLAALRNLPLRTLTLKNGRQLPDMAPLSGKTLEELAVAQFKGRDLSPLGNLSCKCLRLTECPNLVEVTALKNVQVEWLQLVNTAVTDLSCLAGTRIKRLSIQASPIRDLEFARNLPNLEDLDVSGCVSLTDLTPLAGLKLRKVGFRPTIVTKGIEAVRGMATLTEISPDGQRYFPPAEFWKKYDAGEFGKLVTGGAPPPAMVPPSVKVPTPVPVPAVTGEAATLIANLHAALKAKNPDYNGKAVITVTNGKITEVVFAKTGVRDLSPLRGLALAKFACSQEPVTDLSPLQGQPLTYLQLNARQIRDLTPLRGMRLVSAGISDCPVADLEPLRGMPIQSLSLLNLTELNSLDFLRGMISLSTLDIRRTRVQDLSPLEGLKLGSIVFTPANITEGIEVLRNMPSLQRLSGDSLKAGAAQPEAFSPAEFWKKYDAGEFGKPVSK